MQKELKKWDTWRPQSIEKREKKIGTLEGPKVMKKTYEHMKAHKENKLAMSQNKS